MKLPRSNPSLSLLFLLCSLWLLLPAYAGEDSWSHIGTSMTNTRWYIDTLSSEFKPGNVITVWVKSVPDPVREEIIRTETADEVMRAIQEKYFGSYEHTEALWDLDCRENKYRLFYFSAFDKEGESISSTISPDAAWAVIIPGSIGEAVAAAVCGYYHQEKRGQQSPYNFL